MMPQRYKAGGGAKKCRTKPKQHSGMGVAAHGPERFKNPTSPVKGKPKRQAKGKSRGTTGPGGGPEKYHAMNKAAKKKAPRRKGGC